MSPNGRAPRDGKISLGEPGHDLISMVGLPFHGVLAVPGERQSLESFGGLGCFGGPALPALDLFLVTCLAGLSQ